MLRLKKATLIFAFLFALAFSLNIFTGDAQTKSVPKGPKQGINYALFDHADPAHKFDCETCHDTVIGDQRVTTYPYAHDTKLPYSCDTCHSSPMFTIYKGGEMCLICHVKPKNPRAGISKDVITFPDQRDDQFGINFSHKTHKGMEAKDYSTKIVDVDTFLVSKGKDPKVQKVAVESKCIECHAKVGKDKKEENFSSPHHPECARCHATVYGKALPGMNSCEECHKLKAEVRTPITNHFANFYHDSNHEDDSRPKDQKADKKFVTKDGKKLKCQFCHEVETLKKLAAIEMPLQSRCTVCHNEKKDPARPLTADELAKLKPDKAEKAASAK